MTAWISIIPFEKSKGYLKKIYAKVKTPSGSVDNVMKIHSLKPKTMEGHYKLYKSVLHDDNILPLWFLEICAVYTSILNECEYSIKHHYKNFVNLYKNKSLSDSIYKALIKKTPEKVFIGKELEFMNYIEKLTLQPNIIEFKDIEVLKKAGASDTEILEINQVCAYFNYSNRLLNGLGVSYEGDNIGYYNKKINISK